MCAIAASNKKVCKHRNCPQVTDTKTISLKDGILEYSGTSHASVGSDYTVEFNASEFDGVNEVQWNNPKSMEMGLCGGDKATIKYTLKPLKKGKFIVTEYHTFRGDTTEIITHRIIVK